jgi:peptidoglycan/LPS O-acetylase OafA/YrhL
MASSAKDHYTVLDGLRGVAALTVGSLHASQLFRLGHRPAHAYLAVDFFFCLSGFVVALAYDDRLGRNMTIGDFGLRRLIRLYPMIVIGIILAALVHVVTTSNTHHLGILIAGGLLLLPTGLAIGTQAFALNNAMWSLCFEFLANGVYGVAQFLNPNPKKILLVGVLAVLGGCLAASIVAEGGLVYIGFNGWTLFALGIFRVAYPFLAGMLIFRFGLHELAPRIPAFILVILLLCLMLLPVQMAAYDLVAALLIIPALLIISPKGKHSARLAGMWRWSGRMSYPFYLIHLPVLALGKFAGEAMHMSHSALAIPSYLAAIAISACVVVFLDEPIRATLSAAVSKRHSKVFG